MSGSAARRLVSAAVVSAVAAFVAAAVTVVAATVTIAAPIAGAVSIVGSGFSRTVSAQESSATFHAEANYVRVDVYPTRDGRPIADLTRDDFEILEDRVPQRIDGFEHVVVRGGGPQETRREPNTVAESRQAAEDPHARVFVLFLDVNHVDVGGSHSIRKPLTDALDKIIGPDDLVAVMTPEMPASAIAFARKTTTIDGILSRYWNWGERGQINSKDPREDQYRACFADNAGIAQEMIDRRREKLTLDALEDLVRFLRGVREERKAIIAISDGWQLYHPDDDLARPLKYQPLPSGPDVMIDPRTGRLTTKDTTNPAGTSPQDCDNDRIRLAQMDDEVEFRRLLDEANRANASFYPVDPRGLTVFDTPIVSPDSTGPTPPMTPLTADRQMLLARLKSLRTLAEATDGLAIVDSNDLAGGMQRIVADLTSYYLLGYYSTGKLDGKFHAITVRVKRPGVQVRARRGYLAASANDVSRSAAAPDANGVRRAGGEVRAPGVAPEPGAEAFAAAVAAALDRLAPAVRDQPLRVVAASGWTARGTGGTTSVWIAGEIADRLAGGVLDAELLAPSGEAVASRRGQIEPGSTSALLRVDAAEPLTPGGYTVRVHLESGSGSATATVPVAVLAAPHSWGAILSRRGQSTGNKEAATADPRFRRGDRLGVEVPAADDVPFHATLLDRTGKPLPVPVAAMTRQDVDGTRWNVAALALTPLAQGDYVIEVAGGTDGAGRTGGIDGAGGASRAGGASGTSGERTLIAFRVVQ